MAEAILFGIAEEVLKNLGSYALQEIASAWGFKARLEQLKNTISTIRDVLLDAEDRQFDSHAVCGWLEKLAAAVYVADDLFDEFATVSARKQLMGGNKVSKEVRAFFSSSNQIAFAFNVSQKIKTIRQELDDIVNDSTDFGFIVRPHEDGRATKTLAGRDQTYSFIHPEYVIGRDDDKSAVLGMLLASSSNKHDDLSVISIVGIGGMGKTTLAQFLYNDSQVEEHFQLKLWVCVSDVFDIKVITEKILMSVTKEAAQNLEMEQLQGHLRNAIADIKYLLVLDDVWNEDREQWLKLRALLKIGRKGSKILVTTRSKQVATIMDAVPFHELQGLSEEKSLVLFQDMAFGPGQAENKQHLMEVGKQIVQKCANVPLAIRAVGSLLYGMDEEKWSSFKDRDLPNISDKIYGVMDILKVSYQHLRSPLKNCFAYCALFPKDYEFDKETLIDLWMAEGFIVHKNNEGQGLEEVGENYFHILLQRCFFQDIKKG